MIYQCPPKLRELIDLVNATVNYDMPALPDEDTGNRLDLELRLANRIGANRHPLYFPAWFRRWVWTGEIVAPPSIEKIKQEWMFKGAPATHDEIQAALNNDSLFGHGSWRTEWVVDGKPATEEEVEAVKNESHFSCTKQFGVSSIEELDPLLIETARSRYDMIRIARNVLREIANSSGDCQLSIGEVAVVNNVIKISGNLDDQLKEALNGCAPRIRRCAAKRCLNFFWAGRNDAEGCSKKCNSAIRTARDRRRRAMPVI